MTRLRYIGDRTLSFVEAGELEPLAEFTVPDDRAEAFLRRSDIELVESSEQAIEEPNQVSTPSLTASAVVKVKTPVVEAATAAGVTPVVTPPEEG